jgi:predicted branched-subunit amino acid permease
MSISLSQRLGESVRFKDRFLIAFFNTDELFAISCAKDCLLGRKYFLSLVVYPYAGWCLGTLLGALLGGILPPLLTDAFSVAIYAMFIAIVVPVARVNIGVALCALLAIAISAIFYYLPALSEVPSGFVIIIAAIVSAALFAILRPIEEKEDVQDA